VGPARMIVECLTSRPGIREQNRSTSRHGADVVSVPPQPRHASLNCGEPRSSLGSLAMLAAMRRAGVRHGGSAPLQGGFECLGGSVHASAPCPLADDATGRKGTMVGVRTSALRLGFSVRSPVTFRSTAPKTRGGSGLVSDWNMRRISDRDRGLR
jgi:hypothetical protein